MWASIHMWEDSRRELGIEGEGQRKKEGREKWRVKGKKEWKGTPPDVLSFAKIFIRMLYLVKSLLFTDFISY